MISQDNVYKLIKRFRDLCLSKYPSDIDTMKSDDRANNLGMISYDIEIRSALQRFGHTPIDNIVRLVKTPRLLKLILRRTYNAWENLHGEIDFDNLLIANVLRYASPGAFEFILENIQEIRGLESNDILTKRNERLKAIDEKWNTAIQGVRWDSTSVKTLVSFLFPCWNEIMHSSQEAYRQTLQVASPTDYWSRMLSEELFENEIKDQDVLHILVNWKKDPSYEKVRESSLPYILARSEVFADKIEQLSRFILDGNDIRKLSSLVLQEGVSEHGVSACSNNIPGFIPLWRQGVRNPIDEIEHLQWLYNQMSILLPKSLRLSNDVYYYWKSNSESDIHLRVTRPDLRKKIILLAKELFSDEPERFLKTLDPHFMYSSFHFSRYGYSNQGENAFQPQEWRWFAELLLKAGKIDPQTVVPQIANLIVREELLIHEFTYKFEDELSKELFEGHMDDLITLLSSDIDLQGFNIREIETIKCAQDVAAEMKNKCDFE